jgi:hypothetical protein
MPNIVTRLAGFPIKKFYQFERQPALTGVLLALGGIEFELYI